MTTNIQDFVIKVAAFIQDYLEAKDTSKEYNIIPQIGDYKYQPKQGRIRKKQKPDVTGTMISRASDLVPIKGYNLFNLNALLTLIVPTSMIPSVYDAVCKFVVDYTGEPVDFGYDDTSTTPATHVPFMVEFTCTAPIIGERQQREGAGDSATVQLFLTIVAYGNAVLGNDIVLKIDGETIDVLQAAAQISKSYDANNVGNAEKVQSYPTAQTLIINAKVAYRKSDVLKSLVKELFNGEVEATHNVYYADGAAFIENDQNDPPFEGAFTIEVVNNFAPGVISSLDIVMRYAKPKVVSNG